MSDNLVLGIASAVVVIAVVAIFVRDLRLHVARRARADQSELQAGHSLARAVLEAALPAAAVVALVWWAWVAL